jgi:hypothetical protein
MNPGDLVKWTPDTLKGVSPVHPSLQPYYIGLVITLRRDRKSVGGLGDLEVISWSGKKCTWKSWKCEVISEGR